MKKKIILASLMMFLGGGSLFAATAYDTDIDNTAKLNFSVGGQSQVEVEATDSFKVDRKVDVIVSTTDNSNVIANPGKNVAGAYSQPLTFKIKNDTNGQQDFKFSATQRSGGATIDAGVNDNKNFSPIIICDDATCTNGDITGQNVSFSSEGITKIYYLFATIADGSTALVSGDASSINFIATAVNDGLTTDMVQSTGADDKTTVQIVFADGAGSDDAANDGKHSEFSAYQVESADLALVKNSCVISDPINNTNNPKRIPGAIIRYTFEVSNTGNFEGSSVAVTDKLKAALTFGPGVAEIRNTNCNCLTPAGAIISGDTVTVSGQDVTANFKTVSGNSVECAYFDTSLL